MTRADLDSRTRILDAGETLFSQKGFAGTSIKDIGEASQRNTALIHYYFTSKEQLYREVLRRGAEQIIGNASQAVGADMDPEVALQAFVRAQVALLAAKPHLLTLMVREMMDWGATHAADQIHILGATIFRRICGFIEEGQRRGRFRRDADPRFTAISLVAQVNWFMLARPAVGVLLGRGLGEVTQADITAFADHAATLVIGGLQVPAAPAALAARQKPKVTTRRRATRSS